MMMPVFLLLLCIWGASAYSPVCTNRTETSMTFRPTEDHVLGRYRAELCTKRDPNVTEWTINLGYYNTPVYCDRNWTANPPRRPALPGKQHSTDTVMIEDTNTCSHVCYSMDLDLIFSSCYGIKSIMSIGKRQLPPFDSFHKINNSLTYERINNNKAHVNFINHDTEVTLMWYLGIPPTKYKVSICQKKNATGTDIPGACTGELLDDVTDNCTKNELQEELVCELSPPYGMHRVLVQHDAPWTVGVFSGQEYSYYEFNHTAARGPCVPAPAAGSAAVWWACGGALLLAAAALAAAAARRALRRGAYHKRILDPARRHRGESEPSTPSTPTPTEFGEPGEEEEPGERAVLLLYAREGSPGRRVIAELVRVLEEATGSPVYDLFSARVAALGARAPHEWLRAALARRGVRVLLLQTPALAALHRAQLAPHPAGHKLVSPLLGRRAVYRRPQFADAMLQYALRLVVLNAYTHHAYHKYYLATLTELPTEIFPQVVPYRRYALPHAAAALLRDLAPPTPPPAALTPTTPTPAPPTPPTPEPPAHQFQRLEAAIEQFVTHAVDNPNYLMDELLIIPKN